MVRGHIPDFIKETTGAPPQGPRASAGVILGAETVVSAGRRSALGAEPNEEEEGMTIIGAFIYRRRETLEGTGVLVVGGVGSICCCCCWLVGPRGNGAGSLMVVSSTYWHPWDVQRKLV